MRAPASLPVYRTAADRWRAMVEAEHAQTERVRGPTPPDHWKPFAERFRPDLAVPGDAQFDVIAGYVRPDSTLLDVGAGGGRLAVPFARVCRVTAVEPSPSMAKVLQEVASEASAPNIHVVASTWEDASVEPADVVICVNVLYVVREIAPFVRKLAAHARERVVIILYADHPMNSAAPLWDRVYQEERLKLPGLRELLPVLWEEGIYPDLRMLPPRSAGRFASREEARDAMRGRLYIQPGSREEEALQNALDGLLVEDEQGYAVRGVPQPHLGLVIWTP